MRPALRLAAITAFTVACSGRAEPAPAVAPPAPLSPGAVPSSANDALAGDGRDRLASGLTGGSGEGTIGLGNLGTYVAPREEGPVVRCARPTVEGPRSLEAVRRVVVRNLGPLTSCHERGLARDPTLEGRVVVRFVISAAGAVTSSSVAESSVPSPRVAACIAEAARGWVFPPADGGGVTTVTYPFQLSPRVPRP